MRDLVILHQTIYPQLYVFRDTPLLRVLGFGFLKRRFHVISVAKQGDIFRCVLSYYINFFILERDFLDRFLCKHG